MRSAFRIALGNERSSRDDRDMTGARMTIDGHLLSSNDQRTAIAARPVVASVEAQLDSDVDGRDQ